MINVLVSNVISCLPLNHPTLSPCYVSRGHHRKGDGNNIRPGGWEGVL